MLPTASEAHPRQTKPMPELKPKVQPVYCRHQRERISQTVTVPSPPLVQDFRNIRRTIRES